MAQGGGSRVRWLGLALAAATLPTAAAAPVRAGLPVGRLVFASGTVETAAPGKPWARLEPGQALHTGERLRARDALASLEFPFNRVVAGPGTVLSVPAEPVLSTRLEEGRVEARSDEDGEVPAVRTADAEVRGEGHVVVRRSPAGTAVSVLAGRFRVEGEGRSVFLGPRQATVVRPGQPPQPARDLPSAPSGLKPGEEALYVKPDAAVTLTWAAGAARYHVEVLGVDSDDVLISADVEAPTHVLRVPWIGTWRWRVTAVDSSGLEGLPSAEGLICVVD